MYLKKSFHIHWYGCSTFQNSHIPTDIENHNLENGIFHHTLVQNNQFRNLQKKIIIN